MIKLVLVRHGQSEWNLENRFTGWTDVELSPKGVQEAKEAGIALKNKGYHFDLAYSSVLKRAEDTLDYILKEMGEENIEIKRKIGYISDEMYFIETNLERNAKVYTDLYPSWNQEKFEKLYKTFKLNPTKKIQTFSKGMRKQASFCLIMSTMPKYLILDEPIDGLDPIARKLVWKYIIDDVAQRNLTVLISSHNLKELEGIVDHVGILYKGKIMKEFDLEYIQTHIHKIQVSFGDKEVHLDDLNIAYQEERGSVKILIIEDSLSNIRKVIGDQSPLIFDILPLSLEELFIYEVGGEDDDVQKLIY